MTTSGYSPPIEDFELQDSVFATAFSILQDAVSRRAFPAASVAITDRGRLVALKTFGHFTYCDDEKEGVLAKGGEGFKGNAAVSPSTLFDLASLTKVAATTPMAMKLYDGGLLDLDAPLGGVAHEFTAGGRDPRRKAVTLCQLLTHSSGLPAYERLFLKARTREELLQAAFAVPLAADPGSRAEYSDIGFILLGIALERIADETLDRFCQREVFAPLAMTNTTFQPPAEMRSKIPPTADERLSEGLDERSTPGTKPRSTFRNKVIQGEVQDENAWVLGGVAGHAGLFSTVRDLANYAHCLLSGGVPIFRPETVTLFTRRETEPAGTTRALGWDTPSSPSQSGRLFSPQSYGHLGYTGTSLWIDPVRQLSVTLLTNRTWPDCSNEAIRKIRPSFHDAVIEALEMRR